MTERRSLRRTLLGAWLIPAALAGALSLGAFFAVGWVEYSNSMSRLSSDLSDKSKAIARRLSAEILIGPRGAVSAVGENLRADFGLQTVEVSTVSPRCNAGVADVCVEKNSQSLVMVRSIPGIQDPRFVRVSVPMPSYWRDLRFSLLLWSAIPMALLLGLGLMAQLRLIRRYLVRPIERLTSHAADSPEAPAHWPEELALLAADLHEAFLQRDQAMIGQISGGVIHDVKTRIHSINSAKEMIDELPAESPRRHSRLEGLYRACSVHLPKVKAIIEATLDGSRSIPIHPTSQDVRDTVKGVLQQYQEYADKRGVQIELKLGEDELVTAHDALQLERAIGNIVRNGIEAFDETKIADKRLRVSAYRDENGVSIGVEDNGPGLTIAPEVLLSSMRTTKAHGTGLGLLISRKIIQGHQGKLTAGASESLSGAQFKMTIPEGGIV